MHLFTRLPITVAGSLPVIPSANIKSISSYETSAYEHWIFDNGATSLVGRKAAKALTLQSSAPAYSGNFLTFGGNGKSLVTDLADTAAATDTICVVLRPSASTSIQVPFGTLGAANGFAPLIYGSPARITAHTCRWVSATQAGPVGVVSGSWQFLAMSRDFSKPTKEIRMLLGGSTQTFFSTPAAGYLNSPTNIALGSYNAYADSTLVDFAEFIIFPAAMGASELEAAYQRAKARCTARGLAVI